MTYEEFKKWIEDLRFTIDETERYLTIRDSEEFELANVSKKQIAQINTNVWRFDELSNNVKLLLLNLCVELAKTPLKERESQKKYYLKHKLLESFLNYSTQNNVYFLFTKPQTERYQTQFTLAEIEEIKEKFGVSLEDWELVEVEVEE